MAEETKPDAEKPDAIQNLKGELDRKIGNLSEQLKGVTETLKAQLQELKPKEAPPAARTTPKPFRERFYEDEDAAVAELSENIKTDIRTEMQYENRKMDVVRTLYTDFPELADADNSLTKRALEIHKNLDKRERENPTSYRLAVLEAAQELDIKPLKKRSTGTDEWTGTAGTGGAPSKKSRETGVEDETLYFAKAMGMNTEDPKVMEKLKARASRKNWNTYSE